MFLGIRSVLIAGFIALATSPLLAQSFPVASLGYDARELYQSENFQSIGGLDVDSNFAYWVDGADRVMRRHRVTEMVEQIGTLPSPSTGASFVRWSGGRLLIAYAENFNFPPPCHFGYVDEFGDFIGLVNLNGIFDVAVNSTGEIYLSAAPTMAHTKIYRYEPSSTSLVQVIDVGGWSGGLTFDSQDRLYVAEQNSGAILRYTPEQLSLGNANASTGEVVVASVFAGYLVFDQLDRLYATMDGGNTIVLFDVETGNRLRTVAIDADGAYGNGWLRWDAEQNALHFVHSDYFVNYNSSLHALTYSQSNQGIPGTSTVFRGWISAYRDFIQPDETSGGYARDTNNMETTVVGAIIGSPGSFEPGEDANGHVLSLGNGGSITLEFDDLIVNGPGPDFAVFENAFDVNDQTYAELAFIEVGTTTNAWARFPVTYFPTNTINPYGPAFGLLDVTGVDGFAGKHLVECGTPFDLAWLQHHTNVINGSVDLNRIAYVRIADAMGDGSTHDNYGRPVFDPYSAFTSFTDGFDLRGVGVIHAAGLAAKPSGANMVFSMYGYPGRTYQMEVGDGSSWSDHGAPFIGTGGVHQVEVTPGTGGQMFRYKQQIPVTP